MAKKKSVFLPMTFSVFEERFLTNVICKNGFLPGATNKAFVGKYSDGKFMLALYRSEFLIKGDAVPRDGGINLTFAFKIRMLVWAVLTIAFFSLLFLLYSCFFIKPTENAADWLSFFLFNMWLFLLPAVATGGVVSMIRKKNNQKRELFKKLNKICCGLLPEEEEEKQNG